MKLTNKQISVFARQLILKNFDEKKQKIILNTHVTFIGIGGINSSAIIYLLYAGLRNITIIDHDRVQMSNLNRQILYSKKDIGKKKTICAKNYLKKINPKLKIFSYNKQINKESCNKLINKTNIVVDGTDNWSTMLIINDYCVKKSIPLLSASATGYDGNLTLFQNLKKTHLCLRCIFPNKKEIDLPRCETIGILGTSAGIVGILSAHKILNFLISNKKEKPKIIYFDGKNINLKNINIFTNPKCELLRK